MQISPSKVVAARLARAMSQEELAVASCLSSRTIQRIEAGHAASLETTKALLAVLGPDILDDPVMVAGRDGAPVPWASFAWQVAGQLRNPMRWAFDAARCTLALALVLIGLAKPLVPAHAGLFVSSGVAGFGLMRVPPAGSHEVLGYGLVPLMLCAGAAILLSIGRVRQRLRRGETPLVLAATQ